MPGLLCRNRDSGFSLIELAVAIALLAGLLYFLLDRVLYMQEMAEKTEVEETVRSMNYALRLEASSRLVRGSAINQSSLTNENPIKWLSSQPRNYMGELTDAPSGAKPSYWYFHLGERALIYIPNRASHLAVKEGKLKELRFDVMVPIGTAYPQLVPHAPYTWFGEKSGESR